MELTKQDYENEIGRMVYRVQRTDQVAQTTTTDHTKRRKRNDLGAADGLEDLLSAQAPQRLQPKKLNFLRETDGGDPLAKGSKALSYLEDNKFF